MPKNNHVELARHLRMIHFMLMVVCIGLLVTPLLDTSEEIKKASQHIEEISKAKDKWDKNWLAEYTTQVIKESKYSEHVLDFPIVIEVEAPNWGRPVRKLEPDKWLIVQSKEHRCEVVTISAEPPKNLTQFRDLWNCLRGEKRVIIPTGVSKGKLLRVFRFGDQLMVKGYKWKEISDRSGLRTGSLRLRPSSQEQVDSWREHFGENLNFQYVFALDQRHFIPVLSYDQLSFDGQAAFLDYLHNQELQVRWLRGTFESSFRELQGITQNYQDIDLEKLGPILDSEKRRAGESLEFIGLKLPAFVLMTWGVIILIPDFRFGCGTVSPGPVAAP